MAGSPGIILTSQFSLPQKNKGDRSSGKSGGFSSYIDYIKREEALKEKDVLSPNEKNELEIIQTEIQKINEEFGLEISKKNKSTNKDSRDTEAEVLIKITKETGVNSPDFSRYIGYMSREKALQKKEKLSELEKIERELITSKKNELLQKYYESNNEQMISYKRLNDEEIPGTFSIEHNKVTGKEIVEIRNVIDTAEEKGSVMWQDVISFDNNYLEEHGLYNSETGELNEEKIQQASRKMMEQFIKRENLIDPYWFASIHRNTDNIHIHFSTVEKKPSRKMQEYKGQEQPRGKRKQSTIDTMKSSFGNELLEMNEFYKDLSTHRDKSINFFKETFGMSDADQKLSLIMQQLDKNLPDEWEKKVQMNHVSYKFLDKEMKELVDEGVKLLKEDNPDLDNTINNYHNTLNDLNKKMEQAFGQKENPSRSLKEKREADFNERLGNAFLKSMGQKKRETIKRREYVRNNIENFYKDSSKDSSNKKKMRVYLVTPKNDFKKYDSVDKLIWKMNQKDKRRIEEEFEQIAYQQKQRALSSYEQMMADVEKAKEQQGNIQEYYS